MVVLLAEEFCEMVLDVGGCLLGDACVLSSACGQVDALRPPVVGIGSTFEVALGLEVVDELAHRLDRDAGACRHLGQAQSVLELELLHRVAVGGTQVVEGLAGLDPRKDAR